MIISDSADNFCRKYNATIKHSQQRVARMNHFVNWNNPDADIQDDMMIQNFQVRCVEIVMPEDRFRALIENRRWLDQFEDRHRGMPMIRMAEKIVEDWERECILREENENLKAAWERYQVLLNLMR